RFQTLLAQNSIARQTAEDQEATVKQNEGTVLADQGSVAAAPVKDNYCRITSPMAGRVGVRLVDPGNIVTTSLTTGIVSVNQVEPIAVLFTVPQGDFQRLAAVSGNFTRPLAVEALSQETGAYLGAGELIIADNHVDQTTGTVQMKARFANGGRLLWPGQFVNIKLTLETLHNAITVPAAAVNQGPKGAFVYLVGPGDKAVNQPVNVVTTEGTIAVIQGGLTPGQQVVTDGQMSLKPGSTVRIRPWRSWRRGEGWGGRQRAWRMNISAPFIRRPIATSLIAAAFLVFGIVGFMNLPVAALPEVDFPTISVSASLPGASPETTASNIAQPLE